MNLYAVLLDVIVVLILLLITLSAYRKGFLHSVILLAGYVASVIAAALLSGPAAGFIYERFLEPCWKRPRSFWIPCPAWIRRRS